MHEDKRKSLEAQLRQMLNAGDKQGKQVAPKVTKGNVIRRRKGKKDKRFFSQSPV